jgi:hypothetical protein
LVSFSGLALMTNKFTIIITQTPPGVPVADIICG